MSSNNSYSKEKPSSALQPSLRPDLLALGQGRLTRLERFQIRLVRATFQPGKIDRAIRYLQRVIGSTWIHHCTKHLRHVYDLSLLGKLEQDTSYILVSNHRSFFDLYVVVAELVRRGLKHRIVFPVRSKFFYDRPLGWFVNGVMSFFAMYPPIFRERRRLGLNVASLEELVWLLNRGGFLTGFHPEGTRNTAVDPYTLLPAQRGIGRIIYGSNARVVPVFINGLINDLRQQVKSNFDGSGTPVCVVFGNPIDFSDLKQLPNSPKVEQAIADRCMTAIKALGDRERGYRAELEPKLARPG